MHHAADMSRWHGRDDTPQEGAAGRRWHQCVQALPASAPPPLPGIALLGFASDAGVIRNHGRPGAKAGPAALRSALANLPAPPVAVYDAGDIVCENDALETAQAEQASKLAELLRQDFLPITLGGGHEVALGSFRGLAHYLVQQAQGNTADHAAAPQVTPNIGIINFDAHFDLRLAPRGSSGTPFQQIAQDCQQHGWPFHYCCLGISRYANTAALFERARQLNVCWLEDSHIVNQPYSATLHTLQTFIDRVDHVYFTLCLDVLPASVAPGVSAPAALGVDLALIEHLLHAIAQSGKLRLMDVAELNPLFDIDQRTARVAARLLARLVDAFKPKPAS